MSAQTIVKRVEALERQMSEMSDLSVRVGELSTQLSQFRVEVRAEFSAIRAEIAGPRLDVTDLQSEFTGLRTELSDMRAAMAEGFTAVRAEIRAGDEETRHQMRVLHEDLVGRIALLQEGLRPSTSRTRGRANVKRSKKGSG